MSWGNVRYYGLFKKFDTDVDVILVRSHGERLSWERYFNTFGGSPVACAAGLAVLEVIAHDGLQQHAVHAYIYIYIHVCVCIYIYICTCVHEFIYICVSLCMHICMYV